MNMLFSTVILFFMLAPQNQKLPDEFYQIPEMIRETASVIISGTYYEGRSPCIFRPDGTRAWLIESLFDIKRVYRGKVRTQSIKINKAMLPKTPYVRVPLQQGHHYLVLLQPGREKIERIRTGERLRYWEALQDEEIIAIVEL